MKDYLINFENISWEKPVIGVKQKVFIQGKQKIRLVEFSDKFIEVDWCTKGHIGYILKGVFFIDFDGNTVEFKTGDGLFIPDGEEHKHKAVIPKGQQVVVILFEKVI